MPIRFLIGKAGCGKTVHCLNAVRDALRVSPLVGPRLILLVPEQVSLHMERSLLNGLTAAAAHRAEVLSFKRLTYRVLSALGDDGRTPVSANARSMMLRLALLRNAPNLRYYRQTDRHAGFIDLLGRTITEFIEEAVTPEDLDLSSDDDDPARAAKLHDLRLIYAAYLDALGEDRLDPSQQLEVARTRMAQCGWADGALVWVDGFAGFSKQERLTLSEIASRADRVEISLLVSPEPPAPGAADIFSRTRRTLSELTAQFVEQGLAIEEPVVFPDPPLRFANAPALVRIEHHLFTSTPPDHAVQDEGVQLIEAPDRRTEVEWAAAEIHRLVRHESSPLRYRDIAVIVRDLDAYHAHIEAAFAPRDIPFFLDRRRPIAHHPLVELLRSLLALAANDYPVDVVRSLLKTGLLDLDDDQADELENHLVATGVAGRDRWTGQDWLLPQRQRRQPTDYAHAVIGRVNQARLRFVAALDPWVSVARDTRDVSGATWSARIHEALQHLSVAERIEQWAADADQDGELDQAEAHRQIWRDVIALLDDIGVVFGEATVSLNELTAMIDTALSQLTLGLAPPMLDQVLVGTIERSRQPDLKTAILLGVNDGAFPAHSSENAMLNDDDRDWLDAQGLHLGASRRQRTLDEAMLFYIALTRASQSLVMTYARRDDDGKELRPSPYLADLQTATANLPVHRLDDPYTPRPVDESDTHNFDVPWSILTPQDLAAQLANEFRSRPELSADNAARLFWNTLYNTARTDEELSPVLAPALRGLTYDNAASLTPASVESDASSPFSASVSQLETYATCPFKHFAQYRLKLQERAESKLDVRDIGTIHHAILEHFIRSIVDNELSLADLDPSEMSEGLDWGCRKAAEDLPLMSELSHARDRYLAARSPSDVARVVAAQQRVARAGKFVPKRAEQSFGRGDGGWPPLKIKTPRGRTVLLRGLIDRVDLAELSDELLGIVIDYKKTRDKKLDLSRVYHGLSLQLLGYLLVLAEQGRSVVGRPIIPAGAFYVSLTDKYRLVKHPSEADDGSERQSPFKPRGLFDFACADALEPVASGWGEHYAMYTKSDGSLGRLDQSDVAQSSDFQNLMKRTQERMAEWVDRILDGKIAVAPYRLRSFSPCSWCVLGGLCRFEPGYAQTRFLEGLKRSDVFARLSEASEEGADD